MEVEHEIEGKGSPISEENRTNSPEFSPEMSGEAKIREENDSLSNSIHPQSSVNQIKNFNQEQLSKNEDSPQMIEG